MMAWPTITCGALLVMLGVTSYLRADTGTDGKVSPTALIPAGFGAALIVCGALALNPKLRKHVMHAAAMVGLLGVVGGFVPLIRQYGKTDSLTPLGDAARSGLWMALVCAVFVGLCVKSFIDARRPRTPAAPAPTA